MTESNSECSNLPKRFIQALGQDIINRTTLKEAEIARVRDQVRARALKEIRVFNPVTVKECEGCTLLIASADKTWPPPGSFQCTCWKVWCQGCVVNKKTEHTH